MTHVRDMRRGDDGLLWSVIGLDDRSTPDAGPADMVVPAAGTAPAPDRKQAIVAPSPDETRAGAPVQGDLAVAETVSGIVAEGDRDGPALDAASHVAGSAPPEATAAMPLAPAPAATGAEAGADIVPNGPGNETIFGGGAAETLYGAGGSDVLTARGGDDVLYGGIGNDYLAGDAGNDGLYGDAGDDIFYILPTSGVDVIKDYAEADDGFLFYQTGATQWSDLTFTASGNDVHITRTGSSFTVIVEDATLADLDNSTGNFNFL